MKDFEVHEIGSFKEIQLSRTLAKTIEQNLTQYGQVIPHDVMLAYEALRKHYQWQIEEGKV